MATEIEIFNLKNEIVGKAELPSEFFEARVSKSVIHEVVRAEEAALRQGNAKTKTRGEVSGGGIKPWKQKGTGRARHGSIRSPIWEGGGVAFGPQPRSYRVKVNRKVKKQALAGALTARCREERIVALDPAALSARKTSMVASFLKELNIVRFPELNKKGRKSSFRGIKKPLLVYVPGEEIVTDSFRNIAGSSWKSWEGLSARSVLTSDFLIFTRAALDAIGRPAGIEKESAS